MDSGPLTGQTLTVLLSGGVLGVRRGVSRYILHAGLGAAGPSFSAAGTVGWDVATGPTAGYLAGFLSVGDSRPFVADGTGRSDPSSSAG